MERSTNAEIEKRVAILLKMTIQGVSYSDMVRYGAKEWSISSRQIDSYIVIVKEEIKNIYGKEYKESLLDSHLAQLEDLYYKSYKNEDFKECRAIIESRNKMIGLDAVKKVDITSGGDKIERTIIKWGDKEISI